MSRDVKTVEEGLGAVASAIVFAAKELGKEGAAGPGAIEYLGICIKEAAETIAHSIERLASAVEQVGSE